MRNCFTVNLAGGKIDTETGITRRYGYNNQGVFALVGTNDTIELDQTLLTDPTKCFDDRSGKTVVLWECWADDQRRLHSKGCGNDVIVLVRSDRPITCDSSARIASGVDIQFGSAGMTSGGPQYEQGRTYEQLFKLSLGHSVSFTTRQEAAYVLGHAVHQGQVSSISITSTKVVGSDAGDHMKISCFEYDQKPTDARSFEIKFFLLELCLALWTLIFTLLITTVMFPAKTGGVSLAAVLSALAFVVGAHTLLDLARLVAERKIAPRFKDRIDLVAAKRRLHSLTEIPTN